MVNKQNPEASPLEPTGSIARKAEPVTEVPGGYERMPNTTNGGAGTDQSGQAARTLPNEVVAANDGPALVSTDGDSAGTSAAAVVVNQGGDGAGTITDNGFDARRHPGEGQGDGSDVVGTRTTCDANEENNLIGNAIGDSDETPVRSACGYDTYKQRRETGGGATGGLGTGICIVLCCYYWDGSVYSLL